MVASALIGFVTAGVPPPALNRLSSSAGRSYGPGRDESGAAVVTLRISVELSSTDVDRAR